MIVKLKAQIVDLERREKFWISRTHQIQERNNRLRELNEMQAATIRRLKTELKTQKGT